MASKEIELEVIADKTKYTVMSRDQKAERIHRLIRVALKEWKSANIWEQG